MPTKRKMLSATDRPKTHYVRAFKAWLLVFLAANLINFWSKALFGKLSQSSQVDHYQKGDQLKHLFTMTIEDGDKTKHNSTTTIQAEKVNSTDTKIETTTTKTTPSNRVSVLTENTFWKEGMDNPHQLHGIPDETEWLTSSNETADETDHRWEEGIPNHIFKIFLQRTGKFPETQMMQPYQQALKSWHAMNPNYAMQFFDLDTSREYLQAYYHPIFLRAFDCLQAFAAKADFLKYLLLYREGGWYSDWRQVCMVPDLLDELSSLVLGINTTNVPPPIDSSDDEEEENYHETMWSAEIFNYQSPTSAPTVPVPISDHRVSLFLVLDEGSHIVSDQSCPVAGFFGAKARHPVLAKAIHLVLRNIQSADYGASPLHPTGPCLLGQAYRWALESYHDEQAAKEEELQSHRRHQQTPRQLRSTVQNSAAVSEQLKVEDNNAGPNVSDWPYRVSFEGVHSHRRNIEIAYQFQGQGIIQSKCDTCGQTQDWKYGNNYNTLWEEGHYYCEDATALYTPPLPDDDADDGDNEEDVDGDGDGDGNTDDENMNGDTDGDGFGEDMDRSDSVEVQAIDAIVDETFHAIDSNPGYQDGVKGLDLILDWSDGSGSDDEGSLVPEFDGSDGNDGDDGNDDEDSASFDGSDGDDGE